MMELNISWPSNTATTPSTLLVTEIRMGLVSDQLYNDLLVVWPILWVIILPPGLLANGINIRTFLRMGLDDSVTVSFFVLALSDFAHLFFPMGNIAFMSLFYVEKKISAFFQIQPMAMFIYIANVTIIFNSWTSLITAFLAVQRCLCIFMPFHFKYMFTTTRTWCVMFVLGLVSAIPSSAIMSSFEIRPITDAFNRTQYALAVTSRFAAIQRYADIILYMFMNMGCQAVSFGSLIIMSYSLAASVRFRREATVIVRPTTTQQKSSNAWTVDGDGGKAESGQERQREVERQQRSKERTAIIQVALLSAIYLVTNLPKITLAVSSIIVPEFRLDGSYQNFRSIAFCTRLTFDYINSAVNILVYYRYNTRFRNLCFCKGGKDGRGGTGDSSRYTN